MTSLRLQILSLVTHIIQDNIHILCILRFNLRLLYTLGKVDQYKQAHCTFHSHPYARHCMIDTWIMLHLWVVKQ